MSIWEPESKHVEEQMMALERPKAPEKPKPAEGEAGGEEKPPEDPPA